MQQTIPYETFADWRQTEANRGKRLCWNTLCSIAQAHDLYIIANPVNEASFAHFLRSDIQSKKFSIRAKTERAGILNGFIAPQEGFVARPLTFRYEEQVYTAVERNKKQILALTPLADDIILYAACYPDGSFIVSDIDLLFMIQKNVSSTQIIQDPELGELTANEKEIINKINATFSPSFKLIAHGPANHFSGSKRSHIHFPLTIATPQATIVSIGQPDEKPTSIAALFTFLHSIEKLGYPYTLNPNWSFNASIKTI